MANLKRVEYTEEEKAAFLASQSPEGAPPLSPETSPREAIPNPMHLENEKPMSAEKPKPRNSVSVRSGAEIRPLIPTTLDEAYRFAKMMALTYNLPEAYYAAPRKEVIDDLAFDKIEVATMRAIHAIQLGAEVGIPPAQAIQSILVLNGIGTLWGDAQLGLVIASGKAEFIKEYTEGGNLWETIDKNDKSRNVPNRAYTWVFETKRKGSAEPSITKFSIADAIHAGIWGKKSWATHPDRMGKYKARAFGLRDVYADVLKGLAHSVEEFEGETIDVTPNGSKITPAASSTQLSALLENKPATPMPNMMKAVEKVSI